MQKAVVEPHHVKIDEFEGPYDLLLQLVQEDELDISAISLAAVTEQFVQYVRSESVPAEQQADFVLVASTLLLIKLRGLLPSEDQNELEELATRISAYAPLRDQAKHFMQNWQKAPLATSKEVYDSSQSVIWEPTAIPQAMERVLARVVLETKPTRHLRPRSEKPLEHYRQSLRTKLKEKTQLLFTELQAHDARDTSSLLLALLEMARWAEVELEQTKPFGEIAVSATMRR